MKFILLLCLLSITVSCGSSSGGGGGGVTKTEFLSPHDPCIENPADCEAISTLSLDQAIELFKNTPQTQPLEVGLKFKYDTEEDDSVYIYNADSGQYETYKCSVAYTIAKTIIRFNKKYVYLEEVKNNFKLQPNDEKCQQLLNYDRYKKYTIAKEDNYFSDSEVDDISTEQRELINRYYVLKHIKYKGQSALKASGTIQFEQEVQVDEGSPVTLKGKSSVFSISRIGHTVFSSNIASHSITKFEGEELATNYLEKNTSVSTGVSTSHIDLDNMDPRDIEDRTDNDSKKQKQNIFGL